MPKTQDTEQDHTEYHKDGSVWAKGKVIGGVPTGYWEWFRKSGTKMRSGTFENGEQVGEWTPYDPQGKVYKVTRMKPRARSEVADPRSADWQSCRVARR